MNCNFGRRCASQCESIRYDTPVSNVLLIQDVWEHNSNVMLLHAVFDIYAVFLCAGNRDVAECVYCKLRVQGWTSDMVPDVVHQSKSPGCQFIQGTSNYY